MPDAKKEQNSRKFFRGPLSDLKKKKKKKKKNKGPFLAWKLWISPIEKYVNSIFTRKFVVKKKKIGPSFAMKITDQNHRKACEINFH